MQYEFIVFSANINIEINMLIWIYINVWVQYEFIVFNIYMDIEIDVYVCFLGLFLARA